MALSDLPPGDPPAARLLGPYRLLQTLGEGMTGIVYEAERVEFAQRLAIKVYHPNWVSPAMLQRAWLSQEMAANFDHPHIVRTLDRGVDRGQTYLAMELVLGSAIDAHCDRLGLDLRQRIALFLQVLDAVEYAHRRQVVHGDIKPANILVDPENGAKLLDFGTAAKLTPQAVDQTAHAYTPAYASPEQRLGEGASIAGDIFSLGLVARQLFAGLVASASRNLRPSAQLKTSPHAEALAGLRASSARSLVAHLRGDLDAVLAACLQNDPGQRYLSVEAFSADLRRYLEHYPVSTRNTGALNRGLKWANRHRLLAASASILLVTILASTAGVVVQTGRATRERARTERRLHELVQLTGTLDGELYESVRTLPQAEDSRTSLLQETAATLDTIAQSDAEDAVLRHELSGQYKRLAELELAGSDTQARGRQHLLRSQALSR